LLRSRESIFDKILRDKGGMRMTAAYFLPESRPGGVDSNEKRRSGPRWKINEAAWNFVDSIRIRKDLRIALRNAPRIHSIRRANGVHFFARVRVLRHFGVRMPPSCSAGF